jgi:hypothetical protein
MKRRSRAAGNKPARARPRKAAKPTGRSAPKASEVARLPSRFKSSPDWHAALDQLTAASEVLRIIGGSSGDLEPVFSTMLKKAVRMCDAKFGTMYLCEKGKLRLIAADNVPAAFEEVRRDGPFTPAPGGHFDQVIKTGTTVHLPDLAATRPYYERHPKVVEAVEVGGIRTVVAVHSYTIASTGSRQRRGANRPRLPNPMDRRPRQSNA